MEVSELSSPRNRSKSLRVKPLFTAEGDKQSLQEFRANVGKLINNRDWMAKGLVFGCGELLSTLNEDRLLTNEGVTASAIATTLITTLQYVADSPLLGDAEESVTGYPNEAMKISKSAEGITFDFALHLPRDNESKLRNLLWLSYSSNLYQGQIVRRIANALVISGLSDFLGLQKDAADTDELFKQLNLYNGDEYFALLTCLWSTIGKDFILNTNKFLGKCENRERMTASLQNICTELGLSWRRQEREEQIAFAADITGKAYSEAILVRYPLIRASQNTVMVTGNPYIRCLIGEKFITKCQALARSKYNNKADNPYTAFLGRRFELFFGELCSYWAPKKLWSEFKYRVGKDERDSPDWIAVENHKTKTDVTLFQLKCRYFREECLTGGALESFRKEVDNSCAKSIYASIKFLYSIANDRNVHGVGAEGQSAIDQIKNASRWYLVGVYPELPAIFNHKPFRDILIESVKSNLTQTELDWFSRLWNRKLFWHIIDLEEFERFLDLTPRNRNFARKMRGYLRDTQIDYHFFIKKEFAPTFSGYLMGNSITSSNSQECSGVLGEIVRDKFQAAIEMLELTN